MLGRFVTLFGKLRTRDMRAFLVWCALLAYSLQAFIPIGYMPDLGALQKGLIRLTICTGYGRDTIFVDKTNQPGKKSDDARQTRAQDHICPFGQAPLADAPPPATSILDIGFGLVAKIAVLQETLFDKPIRLPSQPRAPPLL